MLPAPGGAARPHSLAPRAPEHGAAGDVGRAHDRPAQAARQRVPVVHVERLLARDDAGVLVAVLPGPAGALDDPRLDVAVLGLGGDDPPGARAVGQQRHEVLPDALDHPAAQVPAGHERVQTRPEQGLGAVDVAHPGDDVLVHEQGADAGAGAPDAVDEALGIGVRAQRIRAQPRQERGPLLGVVDVAGGRAGEVGEPVGAGDAQAHSLARHDAPPVPRLRVPVVHGVLGLADAAARGADRVRRREALIAREGPRAVEPQVDVHE